MITDASGSEPKPNTIQIVTPPSVADVPVTSPGRIVQQAVVPGAIKERLTTLEFENEPALSDSPWTIIFHNALVPGAANSVTWTTTGADGIQLLGTATTSLYISDISYTTYTDFVTNGTLWPTAGSLWDMASVQCSTWIDEGLSNSQNIVARQAFFNNSGAPIFVMSTYRLRTLSNPTTLTTTSSVGF